jgi:hypothetical protein
VHSAELGAISLDALLTKAKNCYLSRFINLDLPPDNTGAPAPCNPD